MSKRLTGVLGSTLLLLSLTVLAIGQTPKTTPTTPTTPTTTPPTKTTPTTQPTETTPTTTTPTTTPPAETPTTAPTETTAKVQAIQNSDGTYTIVEYPIGKVTVVTLNPIGVSGATGTATILRAADGTNIKLNVASLPTEVTAMSVYAIDPSGKVTLLGPVTIAKGAGTFATTTPLAKFMLVASPDDNLSAYNDGTTVFFRSAVPTGLTVIPVTNAVGETVGAVAVPTTAAIAPVEPAAAPTTATKPVEPAAAPTTATKPVEPAAAPTTATKPVEPAAAPTTATVPTTDAPTTAAMPTTDTVPTDYATPMIGIPTFKRGDDTKLTVNFSGAMEGARANVFIEPHKNGKMTEVRMRFHDLKEAPKGTTYILWAAGPNGQFTKLGQVVNVKGRNEAEIKSEVPFEDFGLLLTTEDLNANQTTIIKPSGQRVGVIQLVP